jgi:hypothetical protein
MRTLVVGVATLLLSGCTGTSPDTSVTSTAITNPPTQSAFPGELVPSQTALKLCVEVIGMSEEDAVQTIEGISSEKLTARITRRDGESYAVTEDYSVSRLNLEIDNDIVTKCTIG